MISEIVDPRVLMSYANYLLDNKPGHYFILIDDPRKFTFYRLIVYPENSDLRIRRAAANKLMTIRIKTLNLSKNVERLISKEPIKFDINNLLIHVANKAGNYNVVYDKDTIPEEVIDQVVYFLERVKFEEA